MQPVCKPDPCRCPPVPVPICPPPCPPPPKPPDACTKYYQQIGAEMVGNQLIIKIEKDKSKSKRRMDQWDPPCDCDVAEIQRPTKTEGPKILKRGNDDRILFRVRSKTTGVSKEEYRPLGLSYQVGTCNGGQDTNDECRTLTFYPMMGAPGSQEVHTDQITDGDQNICLVRVRKKPGETEKHRRNIELELRTPRPPTPPPPPVTVCGSVSKTEVKCSSTTVSKKKKKKKKKKRKKK